MPKLLVVLTSPRGDYSISRKLTHTFVDTWKQTHAGGEIVTRDLDKSDLPFVNLPWVMGAYTPAEQRKEDLQAALKLSDLYIAELKAADEIVIGTSMYNFSTPANLKAWIDQIVRINETYTSSYEGLVKNKKVTVLIAAGSDYAPGSHMASYDKESDYLKQIFGFIGITDVNIVMAGGTGAVSAGKVKEEDLLAKYQPTVESAAK